MAGVACEAGGPPAADPQTTSGLHATFDGLRDLPTADLLARVGQRGLTDLTYAELSAMSDAQRQSLSYLARCALEPDEKLEVSAGASSGFVFEGALGLAPEIKTGACETGCQEILTSCLLAHVNTRGRVTLPLWLTSGAPATGRETSSSYPVEEATFFGNLWAAGSTAAYCKAPSASDGVVPGRLGVRPGDGRPYEDLAADKYYRNADDLHVGTCAACTRSPSGDVEACALDGETFTHPMTVWRSRTYRAEAATLTGSAAISGGDRVLTARVSWMNPGAGVTFEGVVAARAGSNTLAFYGSNGDPIGSPDRKLAISINGAPARVETFPATGLGWGDPSLRALTFDGFLAGANTVTFTVPQDASGPDLHWIEVVPAL